MSEIDYDAIVAKALEAFEEREREKEEKRKADESLRDEIRKEVIEEMKESGETWREKKGLHSIKKVSDLGDDNTGSKAFWHYIKTGERVRGLVQDDEVKAGLQVGAAAEGGYLVPDDFYGSIVEQRDELSWPRQAGVQIIQTDRDVMKIPTESTAIAEFAVTAEEATFGSDLPVFGEVSITVYKFTKNIVVSQELLDDNQANLESWMSRGVGRAWGLTESKYTAVGTGTTQPEGVFTGGDTNALTFDTANNITPDEIPELMYKLKAGYAADAVWLMDPQTEGYLRKIRDTNSWAFPTEAFYGHATVNGRHVRTLEGYPVYNDDNIDTIATAVCTIMFGSPWYYCLLERKGLSLLRDPYTSASTGQINFWWSVRFGGAVLQELAWVGGLHP